MDSSQLTYFVKIILAIIICTNIKGEKWTVDQLRIVNSTFFHFSIISISYTYILINALYIIQIQHAYNYKYTHLNRVLFHSQLASGVTKENFTFAFIF